MQKIALIISILALLLAGFSVFQVNRNDHPAVQADANSKGRMISRDTSAAGGAKIAFIRGDSLNIGYNFIIDKQDELISSSKLSESKLQRGLQKAEREYEELMTYAQSGTASEEEMQIAQQRIMELQYELQRMEQEEQQRLSRKEQEMQNEIVERLNNFLNKYAEENGIDLIINRGVSGEGVLYGSEPYDITSEVLQGLNEAYAIELAQKNQKK